MSTTHPTPLGTDAAARALGAVDLLADLDWVGVEKQTTDGRTATVYLINPCLPGSEAAKSLAPPSGGTDKGDRRGNKHPSVGSVGSSGGGGSDFSEDEAPGSGGGVP